MLSEEIQALKYDENHKEVPVKYFFNNDVI